MNSKSCSEGRFPAAAAKAIKVTASQLQYRRVMQQAFKAPWMDPRLQCGRHRGIRYRTHIRASY